MKFIVLLFVSFAFINNISCDEAENEKCTRPPNCGIIQCNIPLCTESQELRRSPCGCCFGCYNIRQVKPDQYSENCPPDFCILADIKCEPLNCVRGQIVLSRGGGPCGCCPICEYKG
ncbi:hypothetical protein JTB14_021775 [Gonioctena quinquepunctata]|nr:hypothetical protein JTB14_021775 [Gonioctena quinquepunctata]